MQERYANCGPAHLLGWSRFLALLICFGMPWLPVRADEWHYEGVKRNVAIGDIHGAYGALVTTLQNADVIDSELAWSGGKNHLVSTGDMLDRGPESRLVMDLIIRLEHEALGAGGRVHLVLGNHEVMNLIGDLRYVADEEYAAFLDVETPKEREKWYRLYRQSKPVDSDEARVRSEFDAKAPPGYFGHRRAFRADGVYGRWLLEKPLMVVVNDTVFVHGGVPPFVADHGLDGVNVGLKNDLLKYVTLRASLEDELIMSPIDRFKEIPITLVEENTKGLIPEEFDDSVQSVVELSSSPLHKPAGPTWYRGTASCNQLIEGDALNLALEKIDANRVVMGHTYTVTRQIQQRMDGRVVEIDTGMLKSTYKGSGNALIIKGDALSVINQGGEDLLPIDHPIRVGHESIAIDDGGLADILMNGDIHEVETDGAAWKLVYVTGEAHSVFAYFRELPKDVHYVPELAAYKLDRMLQLGMVPVTVRRSIAGHSGTLQYVPTDAITERERVVNGAGDGMPCLLDKQIGAMHVFDALIHNATRTPSSMIYSPDDWLLVLIDHENAFTTDVGQPARLNELELAIGDEWRMALKELDEEFLREELSDVLDERRLAALGSRRDALLSD
jgi:hypothetical protein